MPTAISLTIFISLVLSSTKPLLTTNSLKEFIVSESDKIKKQLKVFLPKVKNKVTKIKLQEAITQLDSVYKGRLVKDKQVVSLMRYYELVKELTHVCKT